MRTASPSPPTPPTRSPSALWAPRSSLRDGRLADIAPTMLDLMGLNQPEEMDGKTLIIELTAPQGRVMGNTAKGAYEHEADDRNR